MLGESGATVLKLVVMEKVHVLDLALILLHQMKVISVMELMKKHELAKIEDA